MKLNLGIVFICLLCIPSIAISQWLSPSAVSACATSFSNSIGSIKFSVGEIAVFKFEDENGLSLSSGIINSSNLLVTQSTDYNTSANQFKVFPNPFSEQIEIRSSFGFNKCILVLVNSVGEIVLSTSVEDSKSINAMDLSFLSAGSYILQIVSEEKQIRQNFHIIKAF